jgi:hypothetical protein
MVVPRLVKERAAIMVIAIDFKFTMILLFTGYS